MIKNYIKVAYRNLRNKSGFALINIIGLATGIAASLLLILYIQDELSYDRFHSDSKHIFRIAGSYDQGGDQRNKSAQTTFLLGPELEAISGIDQWTRIQLSSGVFQFEETTFQESRILIADSTFFELFTFPLSQGNPSKALDQVNSVVISQSMGSKYFGEKDPIGKTLMLNEIALKVTGVMEDFPANSHFIGDFVVSTSSIIPYYPDWVLKNATGTSHYTYVKLGSSNQPNRIADQLNAFIKKSYDYENPPEYFLQPIESIYQQSHLSAELGANGDIVYTYIFLTVAIILIVIACINYMNLAIARSSTRYKEVGLRKIVGATRIQLIIQHLTESVILTLIAVVIGGLATELLLPYFNQLSGKEIQQGIITDATFISVLLAAGVLIGLVAGIYPAFYLSGIKALKILKNSKIKLAGTVVSFRKLLIAFQFTATATLIVGTLFIYKQLNFLNNEKLGINTDGVVYFTLPSAELQDKYESIKNDLLNLPEITAVSVSNNNPTARVGSWRGYKLEDKDLTVPTLVVGLDYFKTLEIEFLAGRPFSHEFKSDETNAYVLNEAAVRFLELDNPIGTSLKGRAFTGSQWSDKDATIVGVVKDFHFTSLHSKIQPAIFSLHSEITTPIYYMVARYKSENTAATVSKLNDIWARYAGHHPIDFHFMDDEVQKLYANEERFLHVFLIFSVIAIIIASLGALGLVSYTVTQMTRQIGIRKVLGASVWGLVKLVNQGFFKILALAFIISIPLSGYFINNWLESFAYKIKIDWVPYVQAACLLVLIAVVTTSIQSIKAALTNPVDTLKEE